MGQGAVLDGIQISTLSFVSLTSLLANSILLAASLHRKSDAVTSGDLLVAVMSVADILVALGIPLVVVADFEYLGNGRSMLCVIANSPAISLPCLSLFMLLALTLERSINIFFPLRAMTLVTRTRVVGVIVGVYIYAVVLTLLLPLAGHNLYLKEKMETNLTDDCNFAAVATAPLVAFLLLGNLLPSMVLLLVLNAAIFCVARKHLHRMTPRSEYRRQKSHDNAVFFVCQMYILSYLPVTVALCIDFQGFSVLMVEEWRAPFLLYALGMFMAAFTTVVFPFILIKNNADYKRWISVRLFPHRVQQRLQETETRLSTSRHHEAAIQHEPRDQETRFHTELSLRTLPDPVVTSGSEPPVNI